MADITKIQPIGSSTQYELGARYLTTGRTFQIKDNDATNSGPASSTFNGTANIVINLPSTIKASLTGNASTATKATQDSDGNQINTTYAKLATTNNFVHSGNEWTVVPSGYSGTLYLNYRTCGGTNGNITQYNFGNGKGGVLASITNGTFNGNCTGSAGSVAWGNVTGKPSTFTPSSHTHSYLPLSGGTVTGSLFMGNGTYGSCLQLWSDSEGGNIFLRCAGSGGNASNTGYQIDTCNNILRLYRTTNGGNAATHEAVLMDGNGYASFPRVYGAVWNDYAEFRQTKDKIEPGRCIKEIGDDTLEVTTERLQAGCEIVSDTYGFGIGETEKCKTPTAASGRVLAYPYEDRELLRQHIGEPVCSGPNGTVSLMTHEEAKNYPWLIIGTISAIPDYEEWEAGYKGGHTIKVNGRIWIRIR